MSERTFGKIQWTWLLTLLTVVSLASAANAQRGGGLIGNGGGGGYLCFKTSEQIQAYRNAIEKKNENEITRSLEAAVDIFVLDYLEYQTSWIQPSGAETAAAYVERVLRALAPALPVFADTLLRALGQVKASWEPNPSLDLIDDWGEIQNSFKLSNVKDQPLCQRVQFLSRGHSPTSANSCEFPVVEIQENTPLLKRMRTLYRSSNKGVLMEGILIMHELLYLVGFELGHRSSEKSRFMVSELLSEDLYRQSLNVLNVFDLPLRILKMGFESYANLVPAGRCFKDPLRGELYDAYLSLHQKKIELTEKSALGTELLLFMGEETVLHNEDLLEDFGISLSQAEAFLAAIPFLSKKSISSSEPTPFQEALLAAKGDRHIPTICNRLSEAVRVMEFDAAIDARALDGKDSAFTQFKEFAKQRTEANAQLRIIFEKGIEFCTRRTD